MTLADLVARAKARGLDAELDTGSGFAAATTAKLDTGSSSAAANTAHLRGGPGPRGGSAAANIELSGIRVDSRLVQPGDLFVAVPGTRVDGAAFLADARRRGAAAVVCDAAHAPGDLPAVITADVAAAAGYLASAFHGDPSDAFDLVGVTGTNGKTSCTYLLEAVWKAAGLEPGVIGTIVQRCRAFDRQSAMTTPSAVDLQHLLADLRGAGCNRVAMEVSSHALDQRRVAGCRFRAALFTNLTRDHLDYHGTMEAYFAAKAALFHEWLDPASGVAVLNADDARVAALAAQLTAHDVWTTSSTPGTRARATVVSADCTLAGIDAVLDLDGTRVELHSPLVGAANLSNLLSVAALARGTGVAAEAIAAGLSACPAVPGRMQRVMPPQEAPHAASDGSHPAVFVDYAHTPDALERSLKALGEHRRGRVIVVFGCGGDRDRGKRPIMGRLAAELSDVAVLTSDNPRSEDPHAILDEIEAGIGARMIRASAAELAGPATGGYLVEADRLVAIETAIALAAPEDVVLVAGKGHEDYQEVAGVKRHFDDREVVRRALAKPHPSTAAVEGKADGTVEVEERPRPRAMSVLNPTASGRASLRRDLSRPATLGEAAAAMAAALRGDASATFARVSTDSRRIAAGDLFFCLRGPNFDAHDFIPAAAAAGAAAVVCETGRGGAAPAGLAVLEVGDTQFALGELAAWHRRGFDGPVVGVTGSNGKTTTKEMLRAILLVHLGEGRVLATQGNLNNLIGVPQTIFGLTGEHRAAVIEMGMNAPGEIARLVEISAPTVGLITCVAEAHLEGLGSIEGVARAKGELFEGLPASAVAVVNADDPNVVGQAPRFAGRRVTFGESGDVRAVAVRCDRIDASSFDLVSSAETAHAPGVENAHASGVETAHVDLPLGGRHSVQNATGAAAAALVAGVPLATVARGLTAMTPPPMRMAVEHLPGGATLLNDAYNANPGSLAAALVTLGGLDARRLVVVGDMLELGPSSPELHRRAGAQAAAIAPALVCAYGTFAADVVAGATRAGLDPAKARVCARHQDAADAVASMWRAGDVILVKGSRGSAMEKVVEALRVLDGAEAGEGTGHG